jgi:Domain of unknown function (DUF1707)/Cell wall-active antibiotics response 4TMS YvqF
MTEPSGAQPLGAGAVRASDADRDAAAEKLADAVATGRLTLADHDKRLDALFAAVTTDQLAAVTADLPALPVRRGALYRAVDTHRCVVVGGQAQRAGRFSIGRFCSVLAAFGRIDLDLRNAVPTQDQVTLTVRGLAGTVSIIVPAGWRLQDDVFVLGTRQAIERSEGDPQAPILRIHGVVLGGTYRLTET